MNYLIKKEYGEKNELCACWCVQSIKLDNLYQRLCGQLLPGIYLRCGVCLTNLWALLPLILIKYIPAGKAEISICASGL